MHVSIRLDYVEGAEASPIAYLEGIYVKPAFQKKGVAKRLLSVVEDWAKLKGFNQIGSDTEVTNTLSIDFHKKMVLLKLTKSFISLKIYFRILNNL